MSDDAQMDQAARPKIISLERYSLFASSTGGNSRAKLVWGIRDGNPRIAVFTNDPTDTVKSGVISAPMDPITFYTFIEMLKRAATASGETKYKLDCFTTRRDESGAAIEKVLLSEVYMGKDSDGCVWMSVVEGSRPKIKFIFTISDYHKLYKTDGTELTKAEYSTVVALATINSILPIYEKYMQEANEEQRLRPRVKGAFNKNKPQSIDDEDISF